MSSTTCRFNCSDEDIICPDSLSWWLLTVLIFNSLKYLFFLLWLLHNPFKFSIRNPPKIFVIWWATRALVKAILFSLNLSSSDFPIHHPHSKRNHSEKNEDLISNRSQKMEQQPEAKRRITPRCCTGTKQKVPAAIQAFSKDFVFSQCLGFYEVCWEGESWNFLFRKQSLKGFASKVVPVRPFYNKWMTKR